MNKGYKMFNDQLEAAIAAFPSLSVAVVADKNFLKGTLPVVDSDGKHWEDYDIEIHCSEDFPLRFPVLFETSGKIPRIADWHVNEDSHSCCVKVLPEEIIRCKKGITLTEYIQKEALPYLFNQTHRRVEGYYVNGEYSHGTIGFYEFYSTALKTDNDVRLTLQLMNFIATHDRPSRTSKCFCGSKEKFRYCHRDAFDTIKEVGNNFILSHANDIAKAAQLI